MRYFDRMKVLPRFLTSGDEVLIISPAGVVSPEKVQRFIAEAMGKGLQVEIGQHAFKQWRRFAGTTEERLADLVWALEHPTAKAIVCTRGGYGCQYLLDSVEPKSITGRPKWLVGYSDITALHALYQQHRLVSVHGPMASARDGLAPIAYWDQMFELMMGALPQYEWDTQHTMVNSLSIQAPVIGGNLAMICSLIGTTQQLSLAGNILFIEDTGELDYRLDRMLLQLSRLPDFPQLKAILVGHMTNITPGKQLVAPGPVAMVVNHAARHFVPVVADFPAGHDEPNMAVILGLTYRLIVSEQKASLRAV